jgi:hypothetical protein
MIDREKNRKYWEQRGYEPLLDWQYDVLDLIKHLRGSNNSKDRTIYAFLKDLAVGHDIPVEWEPLDRTENRVYRSIAALHRELIGGKQPRHKRKGETA